MHELSIVQNIIAIAEKEAAKVQASAIEEIELDIGSLICVEIEAFEFSWNIAVKGTLLENTFKTINNLCGKAKCQKCGTEFTIEQFYDPCPVCRQHTITILQGKELRINSLVVS